LRHDGFIAVESEPGEGTVFSIYFVASKDEIVDDRGRASGLVEQVHGKIMVMDDDEMVQNITKAMLTRLGYDYQLAADGKKAVALYEKDFSSGNQADLIIMDLTIPGGMGGEDAVKEILAINPAANVLVSSGYSTDPIMANYKEYGFCGAIVKPYQMKELNASIQEILLS
jgi:CheY-like chemotaxis protein